MISLIRISLYGMICALVMFAAIAVFVPDSLLLGFDVTGMALLVFFFAILIGTTVTMGIRDFTVNRYPALVPTNQAVRFFLRVVAFQAVFLGSLCGAELMFPGGVIITNAVQAKVTIFVIGLAFGARGYLMDTANPRKVA